METSRPDRARFLTTRWSLVLAGGSEPGPHRRAALEELCASYWYPLYAFARRSGAQAQTARDQVQQFFAVLLARNDLRRADPERGRFRAWLLAAFQHFLSNERAREQALKRGGGRAVVELDAGLADTRFGREPPDPRTPEQAYRRAWAEAVLESALAALASEQERIGRGAHFAALRPALTEQSDAPAQATVALELGISENAVRVALHRLRRRLGELVRAEVAGTLDDPGELDDELALLFAALAAS